MGDLAHRVPVDQTPFHLLPEAFNRWITPESVDNSDPYAHSLEEVYNLCHKWVFGKKPTYLIARNGPAIMERVRESNTSIKMFLITNMLAWNESRPDTAFVPKVLTTASAVNHVKTFASICRDRYGTFDTTALDNLTGSQIAEQDIETLLLSSEMTAANWIIGYRLLHSGDISPRLYEEKEASLNPYWLAIEPTYFRDVLAEHLRDPGATQCPVVREHRHKVAHTLGQLKRHWRLAAIVFLARQRIMPEAIVRVLALRGFRPHDFMVKPDKPLISPLRFWRELAKAIQQVECLNFVDKIPSVLDRELAR